MSLELDGIFAGHVSGFSGGNVVGEVVLEKPAADLVQRKRLAAPRIEPVALELSPPFGRPFAEWVKSSIEPQPRFLRKNGAIVEFDATGREARRRSFTNATITGVEFPLCDATQKQPAALAVSFAPETVSPGGSPGAAKADASAGAKGAAAKRAATLTQGAFRLRIQGLEQATARVSRIDAFGVTAAGAPSSRGSERDYQTAPASVSASNLVLTLPDSFAAPFYAWHDEFVVRGLNGPERERVGVLEYLAPDASGVLLAVNLFNLGIFRISPAPAAQAGAGAIATSQVEMYCESVTVDFKL
jgi:hypothetical protein